MTTDKTLRLKVIDSWSGRTNVEYDNIFYDDDFIKTGFGKNTMLRKFIKSVNECVNCIKPGNFSNICKASKSTNVDNSF